MQIFDGEKKCFNVILYNINNIDIINKKKKKRIINVHIFIMTQKVLDNINIVCSSKKV